MTAERDEYPAWYLAALQPEPTYDPDLDVRPPRPPRAVPSTQAPQGRHVWWMVILGAALQAVGMLMVLIGRIGELLVRGGQSLTNHLTVD